MPTVSSAVLERTKSEGSLPNPATQAANIIRYIGDEISRTGEPLRALPQALPAIAGSPNREFAAKLAAELNRRGLLSAIDASNYGGTKLTNIGLTLDGWDRYEAEKRGKFAGKYGFIALKFDDPVLDPLVNDCIKPTIKAGIGYDVVDMRAVAKAGIIDNLMREQIRDAAFVIVDLTHDNSGAYWEAGYAEGLGKPVVYICEQAKFEAAQTHFDTNHCTTVTWSNDDRATFEKELIATLRRSLDLF